ncbi:hypothetical protein [Paraburkholderia xenovorans]
MLVALGTTASHAAQTQLYLTPLHAKVDTIKSLVASVRAALGHGARFAGAVPEARPLARVAMLHLREHYRI